MNKKIVEYKVVSKRNLKTFNLEINSLIKDGWQPIGGHVSYLSSAYVWTEQTMVKYEDKPKMNKKRGVKLRLVDYEGLTEEEKEREGIHCDRGHNFIAIENEDGRDIFLDLRRTGKNESIRQKLEKRIEIGDVVIIDDL